MWGRWPAARSGLQMKPEAVFLPGSQLTQILLACRPYLTSAAEGIRGTTRVLCRNHAFNLAREQGLGIKGPDRGGLEGSSTGQHCPQVPDRTTWEEPPGLLVTPGKQDTLFTPGDPSVYGDGPLTPWCGGETGGVCREGRREDTAGLCPQLFYKQNEVTAVATHFPGAALRAQLLSLSGPHTFW